MRPRRKETVMIYTLRIRLPAGVRVMREGWRFYTETFPFLGKKKRGGKDS